MMPVVASGGDAKGEARGAAHEDVGRMVVDEDRGRAEAVGAEIGAGQLDFAEGQRGGGDDVVDAGIRRPCERIGGRERRHTRHDLDTRCRSNDATTQSIQPGGHIIEDDAPAVGKALELADGKGLGDVEEAEEDESDEGVTPVDGAAEQGDPLAGDFVDDDEAGVVAAGLAGDDGGGGDAERRARATMPASRTSEQRLRGRDGRSTAKAAQRSTAATEPQVPGPGLP